MASQDVLKQMIDDADSQVESSNKSIEMLDTQIADLTEKQTAIKEGVMDVCEDNLTEYLIGTKYSSNEYVMYKGDLFNLAYNNDGNLTDWNILKLQFDNTSEILPHFTYVGPLTFTCLGDLTSLFISYSSLCDIAFAIHDGTSFTDISYANISSSVYDATTDLTTVIISGENLTILHETLFLYEASYNNPSDSTADDIIEKWNFGHDYINREVGSTGTYGTKDSISKLNSARTMLSNNSSKYTESKTVFSNFVT